MRCRALPVRWAGGRVVGVVAALALAAAMTGCRKEIKDPEPLGATAPSLVEIPESPEPSK